MRETPEHEDAPTDIELPGDWQGGDVYHTGGGIYCRMFSNPTRGMRVVYSYAQMQGVGIEAVEPYESVDEPENCLDWEFDHMVTHEPVDGGDAEHLETAVDLMEQVEAGEVERGEDKR